MRGFPLNRASGAVACAAGLVMFFAHASADETATSAPPDFSGVWVRANESLFPSRGNETGIKDFPTVRYGSMFFPAPGTEGGQPLAFLPTDNIEQVVGDSESAILQPWASEVVKRNGDLERQDKYVPTAHGTCWPSGTPEVLNLREPVELLQEKDKITLIYQRDHQVRQIFLNQPHPAHSVPSWYGDSVGHYEGDTLVVDTVAQAVKPMSVVDGFRHAAHREAARRRTLSRRRG
jgi:hypothetical protein